MLNTMSTNWITAITVTPDSEFIAFDTETTGLHPVTSRLVEIGAVRFRLDGTILGKFQTLINPQCPIPADATKVHGITNAMVRRQPALNVALPAFLEFLGDPKTVLLAHHARFDVNFLQVACLREQQPPPSHRVFDSQQWARKKWPKATSYRLAALGEQLQLPTRQSHRALPDALLLKDMFLAISRKRQLQPSELFYGLKPLKFAQATTSTAFIPQPLRLISEAIPKRQSIVMIYSSGSRAGRPRKVTPRAILVHNHKTYLAAWCHQDRFEKTFLVHRISKVTLS